MMPIFTLEQGQRIVEHMADRRRVGAMAVETVAALVESFHRCVLELVRADLISGTWASAEDRPGRALMEIVPADVSRVKQRTNNAVNADDLCIAVGV